MTDPNEKPKRTPEFDDTKGEVAPESDEGAEAYDVPDPKTDKVEDD